MGNIPVNNRLTTLSGFSPTKAHRLTGSQAHNKFLNKRRKIFTCKCAVGGSIFLSTNGSVFVSVKARTHPIPQRIEITAQPSLKTLDAFLINPRRTSIGCHVFPGLPDQPFGYLEGFGLCQRILPFHGCHTSKDRIRSCLCSKAITALSLLLRMTPPLCFASVL